MTIKEFVFICKEIDKACKEKKNPEEIFGSPEMVNLNNAMGNCALKLIETFKNQKAPWTPESLREEALNALLPADSEILINYPGMMIILPRIVRIFASALNIGCADGIQRGRDVMVKEMWSFVKGSNQVPDDVRYWLYVCFTTLGYNNLGPFEKSKKLIQTVH
jgi:hypothetical protein